MNFDLSKLPDSANLPKHVVVCLLNDIEVKYQEKEIEYQEKEIEYHEKIHYLEEQIRLFKNELFGRKSEKGLAPHPDQMPLFKPDENSLADEPADDSKIVIAAHSRNKRGRKPLPKDLPRIDIIHDLAEQEKQCGCGARLSRIGQDISEKLDYIPAKVQVERHIRYKYACKSCEGVEDNGPTVKIAPAPKQLIPKSNTTAGLLAHICVSKFADGLPLYRQQKIFRRLGIDLPRATMAKWLIQAARRCSALIDLMQNEIRSGPLIQIDETPFQVLKESGRSNTQKSYMWVYRGGWPDSPVLLYRYHTSRSGQSLDFIEQYQGYIQSDDFSGYSSLNKKPGIVRLGCWAHARRKFAKVVQVRKKHRGKQVNPTSLADEALDYIGKLYLIEKEAKQRGLDLEQICQLRQQKAKPLLESFKDWLDAKRQLTPPKGLLGQAIHYTLHNWSRLIVYVQDGSLRPDNNLVENAIRPFAVGRKNWLFSGSPDGAWASAIFFSLIETAKINGHEPYAYLRYLFKQLPSAQTKKDFEELLPRNIAV